MSKSIEEIKQEEDEYEFDLGFREWLRDSYVEPNEIMRWLKETKGLFIVTKENIYMYLYSLNNIEYRVTIRGG